ncbi:MAG: PilZ domain-containing protein [Gammaproteobacteria bacterium]|nr:PilZ domain-containing protein [Gammaproteobacteria bacterium]MBD3776324.1 PilZ domain-containing protein [Thiotrichales bacterium]
MDIEAQLDSRVKTSRKVIVHGRNGQAEGELVDLSLKGVGVIVNRGAREGTELEAEFELPALGTFRVFHLLGKVTHRHNTGDQVYLTITFHKLNDEDQAALEDFIDYKNRLSRLNKKEYS